MPRQGQPRSPEPWSCETRGRFPSRPLNSLPWALGTACCRSNCKKEALSGPGVRGVQTRQGHGASQKLSSLPWPFSPAAAASAAGTDPAKQRGVTVDPGGALAEGREGRRRSLPRCGTDSLWGEGEERFPRRIPKPLLGSKVVNWASCEFSTFSLLLWVSLLPCGYFHSVLGTDFIFLYWSTLPEPFVSFSVLL